MFHCILFFFRSSCFPRIFWPAISHARGNWQAESHFNQSVLPAGPAWASTLPVHLELPAGTAAELPSGALSRNLFPSSQAARLTSNTIVKIQTGRDYCEKHYN